jgi:transcription initiation factor IIE alpha subunit
MAHEVKCQLVTSTDIFYKGRISMTARGQVIEKRLQDETELIEFNLHGLRENEFYVCTELGRMR